MPEIWLTMADVRKMFANRSRASIYRDIERGHLPPPTKLGEVNYWNEAQLTAFMKRRSKEYRKPVHIPMFTRAK